MVGHSTALVHKQIEMILSFLLGNYNCEIPLVEILYIMSFSQWL